MLPSIQSLLVSDETYYSLVNSDCCHHFNSWSWHVSKGASSTQVSQRLKMFSSSKNIQFIKITVRGFFVCVFLQQQQFATENKVSENGADLDLKEGFHLDQTTDKKTKTKK